MRRLLGIFLLSLAVLQLGFRGMQRVRSEVPLWDFGSVYAAARTWINHGNPYDLPSVIETWHELEAFADRDVSYFAPVYPPSSYLMIAPFALLPADAALAIWLAILVALLILQFRALLDLAGLRWCDPGGLLLIGASLASAPLQFGILSGQLSIPTVSLCVIAFWHVKRNRDGFAGVLLGIAAALKPQIAAPFVLYYLLLRKWKVSAAAIVVGGAIGVASIVAMNLSQVDWLGGWARGVADSKRIGGVNDYGWTGPFRDEIIDLKMLLVSFLHDSPIAGVVIGCTAVALFAWYVRLRPRNELPAIATLCAISLLPIYHRVYDAALLTIALAWAIAELNKSHRRYALLMMICMLPLLVPFDLMRTLARRAGSLRAIAESPWWQTFFAPHYAWSVLAVTIVLLITMSRRRADSIDGEITHSAMPGVSSGRAGSPAPASRPG